jgi:serine/threonine protein kinase
VGTAIGTPGYAPPEQYQGLADERSDLYALGATLHYMLTGYDAEHEAPFRHPPIRQLNPAISPATEKVVTNLLQVAPDRLPPIASAVRRQLAKNRLYPGCSR